MKVSYRDIPGHWERSQCVSVISITFSLFERESSHSTVNVNHLNMKEEKEHERPVNGAKGS